MENLWTYYVVWLWLLEIEHRKSRHCPFGPTPHFFCRASAREHTRRHRDLNAPANGDRSADAEAEDVADDVNIAKPSALCAWWLDLWQFRGGESCATRRALWSVRCLSIEGLFEVSGQHIICGAHGCSCDRPEMLDLQHVNRWMDARTSAPASQHAHHCGAGTPGIPTDPRRFPTAHPAHSESLSIGAIRGLSPDQISSGMPYNCYDVSFWRTPSLSEAPHKCFFGRRAVSGATVSFVITQAPRAARLLNVQPDGSAISNVGVPLSVWRGRQGSP